MESARTLRGQERRWAQSTGRPGLHRRAGARPHHRAAQVGPRATTAFEQGQGDVLISYENEAIMLTRGGEEQRQQVEISPSAADVPDREPRRGRQHQHRQARGEAFVDFLFTAGTTLWAQAGFRPVIPEVIAQTTALFPGQIDKLWTVPGGQVLGEGTAAENDGRI